MHRDGRVAGGSRKIRVDTEQREVLLDRHKIDARDDLHDGVAMFKELEALRGKTGVHEEILDHDSLPQVQGTVGVRLLASARMLSPGGGCSAYCGTHPGC